MVTHACRSQRDRSTVRGKRQLERIHCDIGHIIERGVIQWAWKRIRCDGGYA